MRIPVVIPCFNQGHYLAEAIESVLAQTKKASEIIVVIDGSTDDSERIARKYQVKVITQVNKGLSSARNTGALNAGEYDYLYPLDADDIMLENCLETIDQVASKTNADIIAPSFRAFGVQNGDCILMPMPQLEDFKTANRIGYFSAIKREAFLEVGGYSPRMGWGYEDYHLWINLLSVGKNIVTIPEVLVLYRTKHQSMIHEAQAHHEELMAQIKKDFPAW